MYSIVKVIESSPPLHIHSATGRYLLPLPPLPPPPLHHVLFPIDKTPRSHVEVIQLSIVGRHVPQLPLQLEHPHIADYIGAERDSLTVCLGVIKVNKSQYWPRGTPKHAETAENEKV